MSLADTIVARATPPGQGALAVLRVSGPEAIAVVDGLFHGRRAVRDLGGFEGAHGFLRHGNHTLDEVVVWVYRAPASYTGEDLVEISCHGGRLPAATVEEALVRSGCRRAQPGEFTLRAFLGGRLDLTQAEAVADLVAARGRRAQERALAQLEGGLARRVRATAGTVREVLARLTVFLDFDEDVPEAPDQAALAGRLESVEKELAALLAGAATHALAREGIRVALAGRPNAGKSSLLNALAGTDRAIVHETPGTTRDTVEIEVEWAGVPVRLIDTAGLRGDAAAVEREGIARSRREVEEADRILWVVDGTDPDPPEREELPDPTRTWVVLNKTDLGAPLSGWVNDYSPLDTFHLSAKTLEGIDLLILGAERELLARLDGSGEDRPLAVNRRHAERIDEARIAVFRAREALQAERPVEMAAADLTRALAALGEITGDSAAPDLLERIFAEFCIGK